MYYACIRMTAVCSMQQKMLRGTAEQTHGNVERLVACDVLRAYIRKQRFYRQTVSMNSSVDCSLT